jgi:XapX domain-containing protein
MRPYLVSLGAGLLVGAIYGALNVRSPAPPVIALLGLLGMLVGEQIVPVVKRLVFSQPVNATWVRRQCAPHVFGRLPVGESRSEKDDVPILRVDDQPL